VKNALAFGTDLFITKAKNCKYPVKDFTASYWRDEGRIFIQT